jgi:hypothetical protein
MVAVNMARGLANGRPQELLAEAARRRLIAALEPRAYGPLAI